VGGETGQGGTAADRLLGDVLLGGALANDLPDLCPSVYLMHPFIPHVPAAPASPPPEVLQGAFSLQPAWSAQCSGDVDTGIHDIQGF